MDKRKNVINKTLLLTLLSMILMATPLSATAAESKTQTVTTTSIIKQRIESSYLEVTQNIRTAIIGKGINVAHELHAGDMLQRTAPAFGYDKPIYSNAEILEFCSAAISQKLARIDPDNIVMCPFTIGVYSLVSEPDVSYVVYQIPRGKPGTEETTKEIADLISGIIEDATW